MMLSDYLSHTVHLGQCVFAADVRRNCEPLQDITHSTIKNSTKTWDSCKGTR